MAGDAGDGFGALLRRHRLRAGLTQEGLAERAGVSARAVSDLERGGRVPRLETVGLLTVALALTGEQQAALLAAARPAAGDSSPPTRMPPAAYIGVPPLFGRHHEQAHLRAFLDAALAGRGSLALISGEAGIGKTALAESLLHEAVGRGCILLEGHCFDLTETPPYGPWLYLFARYCSADSLPPLPAIFAQPGVVREVASQATLFNAVLDFLHAVSAHTPVVVLLDDLHWADLASLDLLRFLAQSVATLPVLLIVTYRSDELTRRHPLYTLLPVLVREAQAERLDLRALTQDDVRAVVSARYRLPDAETVRLVAYVHGRAEGNPFFVGELLRTLEEEGVVRETGDGWLLGDVTQVRVPPLLRQVIDGRLTRLGEEAQEFLAVAAVIGHEIPLSLWAAVSDVDEDTLLDVVERGVGARLLVETSDGLRVRFGHALIRESVYEGVLVTRRRRLHRAVAIALMQTRNPDPDTVADHFRRAGDARAVDWLVKAGERATEAYALTIALERFEAALTLVADADATTRGWHLYRTGLECRFTDPRRGVGYLNEAMHLTDAIADPLLTALIRWSRGFVRCWAGEIGAGIDEIVAGADALEALAPEDRARLAALRGFAVPRAVPHGTAIEWAADEGQYARALALAEERFLPRAAQERHDTLPWADGWRGVGMASAMLGRPAEARAAYEQARAGYGRLGRHHMVGGTALEMLILVSLPYAEGDVGERGRLTEELVAAFRRTGATWGTVPEEGRVIVAFVEGRWDDVSFAHAQAAQLGYTDIWLGCIWLGWWYREQGRRAEAWEYIRDLLPARPATAPGNSRFIRVVAMQRLAVALAIDDGDFDTARAWLEAHDRWLDWAGAVLGRSEGAALWAQYYRARDDTQQARGYAERALTHASVPCQPFALFVAHRLLGELDTAARRFDAAAAHLQESLALADACAAPYERALTLLALAELRAAMGAATEAATLLEEVRAICEPLGAKPALARADALVARYPTLAPMRPQTYPAGLSAREVDVLRLVATGLSNAEIAERLFLSERTVEQHLRSVYNKLGSSSRTAATRFAVEHHLT